MLEESFERASLGVRFLGMGIDSQWALTRRVDRGRRVVFIEDGRVQRLHIRESIGCSVAAIVGLGVDSAQQSEG